MDNCNKMKAIRLSQNMNQEEFGRRLGLSASAVSRIENGERGLSPQIAILMANEFNVNQKWMKAGIGAMYAECDDDMTKKITDILGGDDCFRKRLLHAAIELSDDDIAAFERIFDSLSGIK